MQLQGNAAVRDFDLQGMAQRAQQFTAANGVGQVVVAAVFAVEQHQRAAIVQRVQLALVQRRRLVEAVAITLQQFHQAGTWQATQLLLGAQLHGQYSTRLRGGRLGRLGLDHRRWRLGRCVAQVGKRVFVVVFVFFGTDDLARRSFWRRCRRGFIKARITQVTHFERRLVVFGFFVVVFGFWLGFRLRRWRGQTCVQLAGEVADFILAVDGRGVRVRLTQPDTQLQQRCRNVPAQTQAQR